MCISSLTDRGEGPGDAPPKTLPPWLALIFVGLALLRGTAYAAIIPPWLPYDEHGHFEYAWLVGQHGFGAGLEAISLEFQQRVLFSMYEHEYWRWCHRPMPETLPNGFTDPDDPWLRYSRPQVGDERPLYYWLLGPVLRLLRGRDLEVQLYVGRAFSLLLFSLSVALIYLVCRAAFPRSRWMQLVPALFVLFQPMLGQMGAAVSSDALGVLSGTLVFAALLPIFREGLSARRGALLLAALGLALLSKKTAVFLPVAVVAALPLYAFARGMRLSRRLRRWAPVLLALLALAGLILALLPGGEAAGWLQYRTVEGPGCGPTRIAGVARSGEAAFRVGPCARRMLTHVMSQESIAEAVGHRVTLSGWVRAESGKAQGRVWIEDNHGRATLELRAGESWQPFAVTYTVAEAPRWMMLRLGWAGSGPALFFDDLAWSVGDAATGALENPSAERSKPLLMVLMLKVMRALRVPDRIVERLFVRQSWSKAALPAYQLAVRYCFWTFWAFFGSMSLRLPDVWFEVLAWVCGAAALSALISFAFKPRSRWQRGYLYTLALALLLLLLQTFVPVIGMRAADWLPQGRYLFPGIFPIAVLFAWAWSWFLPPRWERWAFWAISAIIVGFDLACLHLVIRHFVL